MGSKGKRRRELARSTAPAVAERHGYDVAGLGHSTGEYAVNVNEQIALAVDTVLACVMRIADLTADADVGEYRGTERLPDSRVTRRPMATMTRRTWLWLCSATMALYNGVYFDNRYGNDSHGEPISIIPVTPTRVAWPRPGAPTLDGQPIDPARLTWVPRMTFPTVTPELGTILRLARTSIAAAWSADTYRSDFWENGGAPVTVLTSDQAITDPDAAKIAERWVERRRAAPGKPAVLGQGAHAEAFGADLGADGATRALEAVSAGIARYFGMPPWMVNVPSAAGSLVYSNTSNAGLDLVRYTLQPGYAGPLGDAWSDLLPGDYLAGRRVLLGLRHLTLGNALEQAQTFEISTGRRPWLLPSEVRASLGLPIDMALDEAGAPAPAMETIA